MDIYVFDFVIVFQID